MLFLNLFIGNKPDSIDEDESFAFKELRNKKLALMNNANKRYLIFKDQISTTDIQCSKTEPIVETEDDQDTFLGFVNCATIHDLEEKIVHDDTNLNPRFEWNSDAKDGSILSYVFVNIDTDVFTPLIYDLPKGSAVKDSYHYGRHYYGFILEIKDCVDALDPGNILKIYGYDKRLKSAHAMSNFHKFELYIDARRRIDGEVDETDEHQEVAGGEIKHAISISHSGMNRYNRKEFFRMQSMYKKNDQPRTLRLSGDLFTHFIIGTVPPKTVREIINSKNSENDIINDISFEYIYVPREDYQDEKDWYQNGVIKELEHLRDDSVRAVTVTDDIRLTMYDVRKTKMQQVLALHNDGTITSIISNR